MVNGTQTKNGMMVVAAVVAVVFLLIGGDLLWSYWQGVQGVVRKELRGATSVQFDLVRLEQAVNALTPVLKANKKTVTELGVEIEFLEADTAEMDRRQTFAKAEMQELRNALVQQTGEPITIDGKSFTRAAVEDDLSRRLRTYEQAEKLLLSRKSHVSKRRETLNKALACIKQNEQDQQALADQAETLNAEVKLIAAASATSHFNFQSPDLSKAKEQARDVLKRVETLKRLCDQEELSHEIPVNLDRRTALERYDAKFAAGAK